MKTIFGAMALGMGLAAATPAAADITVCIWGTITGPDALVNGMAYGFRDYFQYLNQTKGGIAGQKINTPLFDGRYKLDEELKNYRRCVDEEKAVLVGGWSTGAAKALRDQINTDQVPYLADSFSADVVNPEKYPYEFIAGATYEQQLLIGLRDLAKKGGKKVILLYADNEYGRGPINNVIKSGAIKDLGLTVADRIEFRYDTQDLTAQMLRVKAAAPDLVYIQASTPQAIVALRDAAKAGLPASLIMGNMYNISPAIPKQLGAAAEGFRSIQMYSEYGAKIPAQQEIDAYAQKNEVERKDVYFMKGWFKGKVVAAAIEAAIKKAGGKVPEDLAAFRKEVRAGLEGLKDFDVGGITPPVNYADHQGSKQARISEIKNGAYVPVGEWIQTK